MTARVLNATESAVIRWLTTERPPTGTERTDYARLVQEIRPGDVLLVEGRSRVSDVIKLVTQSTWTHAALYIGPAGALPDPGSRRRLAEGHPEFGPATPLLVEAELGSGTVAVPLDKYLRHNVRICRPIGLTDADRATVIAFVIDRLGSDYNVRQLLDLARFLFPYAILPRRWRSSLFEHADGARTRQVCSSMVAEAFQQVNYPILPFIERLPGGRVRFLKRNPRLFTPRDFDSSPYFDIVKYPYLGPHDIRLYREIAWDDSGVYAEAPVPAAEPATLTSGRAKKENDVELPDTGSRRHHLQEHPS